MQTQPTINLNGGVNLMGIDITISKDEALTKECHEIGVRLEKLWGQLSLMRLVDEDEQQCYQILMDALSRNLKTGIYFTNVRTKGV